MVMKPLKSALFLAGILLIIQGAYFLMPREGITLLSIHLKNPLPGPQGQPWFLRHLSEDTLVVHPVLPDTASKTVILKIKKKDTLKEKMPVHPLSFIDSLTSRVPRLEMNDTARKALFHVFSMLDSVRTRKERLHILYYGDSQIEGDRITSLLRDSLQARFGGGGPGLFLPLMTVPFTTSLRIEPSGTWIPVSVSRKRTESLSKIPAGIFGGSSVYIPGKDTATTGRCRIAIQPFASERAKKYNRIGLWLYPLGQKGRFSIHAGGKRIAGDKIDRSGQLAYYQYAVNQPFRKLDIFFHFTEPVAVEGIFLEDSMGVGVDNIPLRGSRLMPFSKCDRSLLQHMIKALNVRMIVLQFGLNVAVGGKREAKNYRETFTRQLKYLRQSFPEVFVVVVGVTDMAGNDKELDEKIRLIRDEQKKKTLAMDYAFWDAYQAMGGKNSIIRWAHHQPSLARPDYAHLSFKGSQILGSLLITSLLKEYKEYQYGQ